MWSRCLERSLAWRVTQRKMGPLLALGRTKKQSLLKDSTCALPSTVLYCSLSCKARGENLGGASTEAQAKRGNRVQEMANPKKEGEGGNDNSRASSFWNKDDGQRTEQKGWQVETGGVEMHKKGSVGKGKSRASV
eukprot:TRINITY_DN3697_c0_g2_i1.p1 TRINITY_DN3697_c0_g2~~TRINITY_DN3697_c0_g2_i1.p1  ORF type:complete len:135 (-),score=18.19 TRINITY_DN3697_c0_g2_i1:258-662(-)